MVGSLWVTPPARTASHAPCPGEQAHAPRTSLALQTPHVLTPSLALICVEMLAPTTNGR